MSKKILAPVDGLRLHVEAQQPHTPDAHEKVGPFQVAPQAAGEGRHGLVDF